MLSNESFHTLASQVQAAVEGAEGVSDLAKQGILGAFCALLISALIYVTRNWKGAMEARITDAQGYSTALKGVNDASMSVTVETNRTNDALKSAFNDLRVEVGNRKEQLQTIVTNVAEMRTEQVKFLAASDARDRGR